MEKSINRFQSRSTEDEKKPIKLKELFLNLGAFCIVMFFIYCGATYMANPVYFYEELLPKTYKAVFFIALSIIAFYVLMHASRHSILGFTTFIKKSFVPIR